MIYSALFLLAFLGLPMQAGADTGLLEKALGRKGSMSGDEFKVAVPQQLEVKVDGFEIIPEMGLTSWVAFTPHGKRLMAMGDLVLLEDEIGPVQRAAVEAGLSVTAIHNHFLRDKPKVMFMHVGGMGAAEELAGRVRKVLDRVDALRASKTRKPDVGSVLSSFDPKKIESVIGHAGELKNGVYKIVIGRPDVDLRDMGKGVSKFMGFNTWMAFQGSEEKAAVSGDFAMLEAEVDGVVRELVEHGIEVTAVHNHMVTEKPTIYFLHFWGVGTPANLAAGLRAALDRTGKAAQP